MMKLQRLYIMLVSLILVLGGCDKLIYDQPDEVDGGQPQVFLSVNIRSSEPNSGLRSINYDDLNEDRVNDLAMVIFKSSNGERVGVYTTTTLGSSGLATYAFTAKIAPDKYDFFFVANMKLTEASINATIANRDQMVNYLQDSSRKLSEVTTVSGALYEGASASEGFPMARVYLNQDITPGGTVYQPKPFKPSIKAGEADLVIANSAGDGTVQRDYVELIRVVAKLEVIFDANSALVVDKVYFRNANSHFRLVEFDASSTTSRGYFNDHSTDTPLKDISPTEAPKTKYIYYMPETFIPSSPALKWSDVVSADYQPINYFTVITSDNTVYDIPIISNETSITADYMDKAKGTGLFSAYNPDYNIYRNHHYKFEVTIQGKIEIFYVVNPWNKVSKQLYMGYGYNVEVDENGKITINNTVDACAPHGIVLKTVAPFKFTDDTDEKSFKNGVEADALVLTASESYTLSSEPASGDSYLQVWYNDILVKTFTKP